MDFWKRILKAPKTRRSRAERGVEGRFGNLSMWAFYYFNYIRSFEVGDFPPLLGES